MNHSSLGDKENLSVSKGENVLVAFRGKSFVCVCFNHRITVWKHHRIWKPKRVFRGKWWGGVWEIFTRNLCHTWGWTSSFSHSTRYTHKSYNKELDLEIRWHGKKQLETSHTHKTLSVPQAVKRGSQILTFCTPSRETRLANKSVECESTIGRW